jgi:hypothetical protein
MERHELVAGGFFFWCWLFAVVFRHLPLLDQLSDMFCIEWHNF